MRNVVLILLALLPSVLSCAQVPTGRSTEPKPADARRAKRQALIEEHARDLLAKARALQKTGKMLEAYRHAVQVLHIDPLDGPARALAAALQPAALAEWRAAWAKRTAGRPMQVTAEEIMAATTPSLSAADRAVWKRLHAVETEVSFARTKFVDAIQFLRDVSRITMHVKWRALEEVGIMPDTPLDTKLKKVSLYVALRLILDDVSGAAGREDRLGFVVRDGVLRISTNADLRRNTHVAVYDIRDLLRTADVPFPAPIPPYGMRPLADSAAEAEYFLAGPIPKRWIAEGLIALLQRMVDPESWIEGSPTSGSVNYVNGRLVINQIDANHRRIRCILGLLRWASAPQPPGRQAPPAETAQARAVRELDEKMQTVLPKLQMNDVRLADAVEVLCEIAKIPLHVKWHALEDVGILKDTPARLRLNKVPFRVGLDLLLDDVSGAAARTDRLAFTNVKGVLVISTNADLDRTTTLVVHDVRDLLADAVAEKRRNEGARIWTLFAIEYADDDDDDDGDDDVFSDDDDDDDDDDDVFVGSSWPPEHPNPWFAVGQKLVDLLHRTIDPESWIEGSPTSASIRFIRGVLIIKQTPRNHERIAALLTALRKPVAAATQMEDRP